MAKVTIEISDVRDGSLRIVVKHDPPLEPDTGASSATPTLRAASQCLAALAAASGDVSMRLAVRN